MSIRTRMRRAAVLAAAGLVALTGCSLFGETSSLVHADPSTAGYVGSMQYSITATPGSEAEVNNIAFRGANAASPMPLLTTVFGKGANTRTQGAQITAEDGTAVNVLSMNKWGNNVGLTEYLQTEAATYEQRDALGNRTCGAKVKLDFKPNLGQQVTEIVKKDRFKRAFDAMFYYQIPCGNTVVPVAPTTNDTPDGEPKDKGAGTITKPNIQLDMSRATFLGLVINQKFAPRVTGKPIVINRGHSATVVGGRASRFAGGWWQYPASQLNASNVVLEMVNDLDKREWLDFSDPNNGGLVYSAGDADVYASWRRVLLDRQSDYLVNFRGSVNEPWKRVAIKLVYNSEWNDFKQNYEALKGTEMPDIDDMIDQETGLPKDMDDPDSENTKSLKEIEAAGCQNCPNATLEQIQFVDATEGSPSNGKPLYAMTIRGWLGSNSSLVMFGAVPGPVDSYMGQAENNRKALGMNECPIQRNEKGEPLEDDQQYTKDGDSSCTRWLREGALWDLITKDASKFNFDVVGQFRVRDNSTWVSNCDSEGYCYPQAINRKLDAAYMFTDTDQKLKKAWTILQLLGEVGMRTTGMSYASGQYDGSGLDFAMAQPGVYNAYYTNMADKTNPYNPELLFSLDARALQLPNTLGEASKYLYGK